MTQLTKDQIKDYVLRYADDQESVDEAEAEWVKLNVKLLVQGDTTIEHKTTYSSNIYKAGEYFFDVTFSSSNSGYWGDGENYPTEIYEVKPVEVTKTEYHVVQ